MVDIHTHILPGIDDGARDWEDSYRMAAMAADSGVDTIVCSHHANIPRMYQNYNSRYLWDLFEEFEDRLYQGGFPLRIVRGMEIYCTEDVVEKIQRNMLLPINRTDYYLVEFGFYEPLRFMEDTLYVILSLGKVPIIAHPERYIGLQEQPEALYDWMRHGVLSQVNRGSLQGRFGPDPQLAAEQFMEHRLVTCIATDAHSPHSRTTDMRGIYQQLSEQYSPETADRLLDRNPRRIVEGKRIQHRHLIPFGPGSM